MGGVGRPGGTHRGTRTRRPGHSVRGAPVPAPGRADGGRLSLGLVAVRAHGQREGRGTIVGVRRDEGAATTSAELRAHNLARLLRAVHYGGGQLTRAELTRQLSLARGTATVLVRDLAGRRLIEELTGPVDATVQRARGRPTGVPSAHAQGPVALAVDLRDDSFTLAAFELTGRCTVLDRQERDASSGTGVLADVAARLRIRSRQFGGRLVGIGVAVPSPVSGGKMVQPTLADWRDVDVARALAAAGPAETGPVLAGNDATLAGLAEARRGVLRGVSVALHL